MSQRIWCNGRVMDAEELRVSPFDRGLTIGLGLFETLLAIDGRPVFFDRHWARHAAACRRFGWTAPDPGRLREAIGNLLRENKLGSGFGRVRWFQTAGGGALDQLQTGADALTLLTATAAAPVPDSVALTLCPWTRNERSPLAGLKTASYAENALALADARAKGFDESLWINGQGEICEASTANVFAVIDGCGFTPPASSGCLPGVTRAWVLEAAPRLGLAMEERVLSPADLARADELFLTSATRGVVPVSRLDDQEWNIPGEWTGVLRAAWRKAIYESATH